jgi:16S rRNA (cytidine1402-2'-O)-methyltransferase
MPAGALRVVATPIGNLGDITYRAVEALKGADLIACEDTRHSRVLLDHYGIRKPLLSYHDFSESRRAPEIVARILEGQVVALICDAGTPGVADPGFRLVREAIRAGVRVETLPGPSAMLAALAVSGLPTDRFAFEGFLPVKSGARRARLESLKGQDRTVILYESPHRILKTLEAIREVFGGGLDVVVARELTKKFEEIARGTVAEVAGRLAAARVRGEFTVLFHSEASAR